MATQLATLFLRRLEVPLVITDVDAARVEEAVAAIRADLEKQAARGRLSEGKARFLGSIVTRRRRHLGVRRLRSRDRGGLRGDRRQAGGLRRARGRRLGRVPARHEHVVALRRRDGGASCSTRERVVGMHFFNPVAVLPLVELVRAPATDDVDARDRLGRDEEARQARRPRPGRARLRRQPAAHPPVVRADAGARERQHLRGDRRRGAPARAPDAAVGAPRDGRPAGREPRPPHPARRVPGPLPALADARRTSPTARWTSCSPAMPGRPRTRSTTRS